MKVNSVDWWNDYFEKYWEKNEGCNQSSAFMKKLLVNIPNNILIDIFDNSKRILDWGCALGDGTKEIFNFFDSKKIYGIDISEVAIVKAEKKYKEIDFILNNKITSTYDVVFNSNSLEHFKNPVQILSGHLKNVNNYYIILVPYEENPLSIHHLVTINDNTFPKKLESFEKIHQKVITMKDKYWPGNQLLIVYKNNKSSLSNINNVKTWDEVAESYTSEISDIDVELSDYLLKFMKNYNLDRENSIIELGCGSGHISLKLKESGINKVSLLDFSNVALDKAKKVFDKEKGIFLEGDLLDLDLDEKYDITWNSGVLEHFNDEELLNIINNIYAITKKYFICIVPNPKSLVYLLMRRNRMVNNTWEFGIEYLRTNYEEYFEKSGFNVKYIDYIGKEFSKYFLKEVFMEKYEALAIDDLLIDELYSKENNYLQVFICEVKNEKY